MGKELWKPGNMLYPLPAVMVSCQEGDGSPNIITVAWTGTICTNPAMVYISVRPERYSYDIIKKSREFVINLTTKKLVKAVDYCGVRSGRDVDKFKEMKLTPVPGEYTKAPLIKECPVNIECKVVKIEELGSHHMFIARVVGVHVDTEYMNEKGKFELNNCDLIAYSHGQYFDLGNELGTFGYSVKRKDGKTSSNKRLSENRKSSKKASRNKASGNNVSRNKPSGNKETIKKEKNNKVSMQKSTKKKTDFKNREVREKGK